MYTSGIAVIDMLQDIYTFLPDMKTNDSQTNERYLKFLAPLSYNSSLRVSPILININLWNRTGDFLKFKSHCVRSNSLA